MSHTALVSTSTQISQCMPDCKTTSRQRRQEIHIRHQGILISNVSSLRATVATSCSTLPVYDIKPEVLHQLKPIAHAACIEPGNAEDGVCAGERCTEGAFTAFGHSGVCMVPWSAVSFNCRNCLRPGLARLRRTSTFVSNAGQLVSCHDLQQSATQH